MKTVLLAALCTTAILGTLESRGITVEELHNDPSITPETFARRFAKFKFVFGADVRTPEQFLGAQAGDCDDYSTLADAELKARGYHTRLVSVRLKNVAHVICYVEEAHGYLDYNLRANGAGLVPCGPDLIEMADAVAKSFKSTWRSASEFTFNDGVKRLVQTKLSPEAQKIADAPRLATRH